MSGRCLQKLLSFYFIFRFCLLVNQCECLKNQKLEQVQRPWVSYMFAVITTTTCTWFMKFIRHMVAFGKLPIPANMRHMSAIVFCHIKSHHITLLHFTEHYAKLITSPLLCFTAHITKLNTSQLLCVHQRRIGEHHEDDAPPWRYLLASSEVHCPCMQSWKHSHYEEAAIR